MADRIKLAVDALRDLPYPQFLILADALRAELDSAGAQLPDYQVITTTVAAGALAGAVERLHVELGGE